MKPTEPTRATKPTKPRTWTRKPRRPSPRRHRSCCAAGNLSAPFHPFGVAPTPLPPPPRGLAERAALSLPRILSTMTWS